MTAEIMNLHLLALLICLPCLATAQPEAPPLPVAPPIPSHRGAPGVQERMRQTEVKVLLSLYEQAYMHLQHAEIYVAPGPETNKELAEKKQRVQALSEKLSDLGRRIGDEMEKRRATQHKNRAEHQQKP